MVRFVGVQNAVRWIQATGLETILGELSEYVADDYRRWESFDKSPRVANHSPIGVIELMPTSDGHLYGFKYVNGHPSNPSRGLQTVTAFGVLSDVASGYPLLVAEMTLLTALRTAATSAMAAKHLARPDSTTMAMIGAGTQAEFQAIAVRETLGIRTLRVFDTDPLASAKLVRNLTPLGFDVYVASDSADAVAGADVITTCTADKANATVLTDDMVQPGVHINAIGGDCPGKTELDAAILRRADVFVEFPEQTRIEGEIQQVESDFAVTELWQVVSGTTAGRASAEQITVFDSVGFAIEDFSVLRYLHDKTNHSAFSIDIDLVADPDDPKDLFGFAQGSDAPVPAL
ncbi:ornithine cyclodeaminase [Paramicrobacterium chengjingii]|uniref:Ornithine cyclodeaminase n=1 Tax=Paramicrobacterium chengjingii TaxID=2769067 RepID=A0ABX6YI73_9MICO|nr:ornithine cyclodeaminase [Microbacterium chengjingii]QPZ38488.1 ornithine cyclodeaminase [Microbacterium chengjingii]